MTVRELQDNIIKLKKETNTAILAHCYQAREICEIADFVGDSYKLSVDAKGVSEENIIFCGVHFMAETAKMLSPQKRVYLSSRHAGCPMAEQMDRDMISAIRAQEPDRTVVAYINTTAALKTVCDVCVTSSSALKIVKALDSDKILFIPDCNLGDYLKKQCPDKDIKLLQGGCSENALKDFIYEIIEARSRKYSRLNRMLSYSNLVLGEPAISTLDKRTTGKEKDNKNIHNDLCVIGYLRPDYYELLSREGLLSKGKTFVFYYYAIKGESVYSHHEDIGKAKYIRFYQNDINATGTYEIEPLKGIIRSRELVSKKQLDELLTESGANDGKERSADFYYVLKVEIVSCTEPKISCKNSDLNGVNGNDTFSPHSPKVMNEDWLLRQEN